MVCFMLPELEGALLLSLLPDCRRWPGELLCGLLEGLFGGLLGLSFIWLLCFVKAYLRLSNSIQVAIALK